MRDPKRIPKILKQLGDIWLTYPDLRLGQLILNAQLIMGEGSILYNLEDDELIEVLNQIYIQGKTDG